jgi:ABC-type transport system involved in cytochrome bd biosynthesis fused ATPase/permease subunit
LLNLTIKENILSPNPSLGEKKLEGIIGIVGLKMFFDHSEKGLDTVVTNYGLDLSLGIRCRIALARALVNDGQVVLLDEPTAGMDSWGCSMVYKLMNDFIVSGKTIIVASHDKYILQGAKYILNLDSKPVPSFFANTSQSKQVEAK